MYKRIRDFLYSLKSKKAKRRVEEKAFAAVGEPPEQSFGAIFHGFITEHWKFVVTSSIAIFGLALAAARFFF